MRIDRVKFAAEMARSGMKVYEVADRAGVSRGTITAVKNGKSCSMVTAEKIAICFGVGVEDIQEKVFLQTKEATGN